jgi:hypothetical protein
MNKVHQMTIGWGYDGPQVNIYRGKFFSPYRPTRSSLIRIERAFRNRGNMRRAGEGHFRADFISVTYSTDGAVTSTKGAGI